MKRRLLILAFALSLLIAGCSTEGHEVIDSEPTAVYDWMADESPVPNKRMGILRAGVNHSGIAVSPTGVYAIREMSNDPYIRYVDHNADSVVKLCGRVDCTHTTDDCNAYLYRGSDLSYYNGYLYAVCGEGAYTKESKLIRMDSDGSNRITLLDFQKFAKEHDGEFVYCHMITDGYCVFSTYSWKQDDHEEGILVHEWLQYYVYKLDGSMKEPKAVEGEGMVLYNCGNVLLTVSDEAQNGGENDGYWAWRVDTDTVTYLTDAPGVPGWFGEEAGYYFKNGAICRLAYSTQKEEIMVDTTLEGKYYMFSFPDCAVVASREQGGEDDNLYIYNWDFELVDTVSIEYPYDCMLQHLLIAETADRLILSDEALGMPKYYINKSELGSGNAKVRAFEYV